MVSAIRPTASSLLFSCRWSWAPLRHSQPEMAARGVMRRKQAMSHSRVRFSLRGPGSFNHWAMTKKNTGKRRMCWHLFTQLLSDSDILFWVNLFFLSPHLFLHFYLFLFPVILIKRFTNEPSTLNKHVNQRSKCGWPAWVAEAFVQWWIPCDRVHSSWCWRKTATSPSSFCALFPVCPCSRRARAGFLLQLLRDRSDTCPRHCREAKKNKQNNRTVMKGAEMTPQCVG